MDNPEIKNWLKSAKEAIKNKEFREALKLCKQVIDKDKENYNAWLFTAAAAQELNSKEQALAAFQRAIQISPKQAPAWQGLAQFYEKQSNFSELLTAYNELRKIFESDAGKYFEYSLRYAGSLKKIAKFSQAVAIYSKLLEMNVIEKNEQVIGSIMEIIEEAKNEIFESKLYSDVISYLKEKAQEEEKRNLFELLNEKLILAMIKEKFHWDDIEKQCLQVIDKISKDNCVAIQTLMRIYTEINLLKPFRKFKNQEEIEDKTKRILELVANDERFLFYKNIYICSTLLKNDTFSAELKTLIQQINEMNENLELKLFIQNRYFSLVSDNQNTVQTSKEGIAKVDEYLTDNKDDIKAIFIFNEAVANFDQKEFKNSTLLFNELIELRIDTDLKDLVPISKLYLILSYLETNSNDMVDQIINSLTESPSIIQKFAKIFNASFVTEESKLKEAFYLAKELVETPNSYSFHFDVNLWLAKICLKLHLNGVSTVNDDKTKELCLNNLLKAIRTNPYKYEGFFHLGIYYKDIMKDSKRALKCFQKAYEICNNLNISGLQLVDCLLDQNEQDIALNILKKTINEIRDCKWAYLRLGLLYLSQNNFSDAIKIFHVVIRSNPDDFNTWECLAEAYLNRGSLTAALKSFEKAVEINPNSNYAKYQVAFIKQSLNMYDEAISDYLVVLESLPNHVPTLKGLGEAYFLLATENIKNTNDNKYLEYIETSLKYLGQCVALRNDLCCVWKIMGDCCSLIHVQPDSELRINVPKILVDLINSDNGKNENLMLNKAELLKLAEKNYMTCCKLKPDLATNWYDLALSYFYQSRLNKKYETIMKSLKCILHSLNLNPDDHNSWNLLAILYTEKEISKHNLAQHCYIKALHLDENSCISWTNIGVFYLKIGNIKLAHECFKKAQALDPDFNVSWIGQAFIAESIDIEQCVELYRHAVDLMHHTEAQYGYARIVCRLETDSDFKKSELYKDYIVLLNAITTSSDSLIKYLTRVNTNSSAYLLCGILLEKQGLLNNALSMYKKLLQFDSQGSKSLIDFGRRCYARVLCQLSKFNEALMEYKNIDVKSSIEDIFALARVFFKVNKFEQSFKVFESGLLVCSESDKSIVYAALGMAASKFSIESAVTNFFKSFQTKPVCMQSLFALCSIGFIKNDMKLIAAVFKELDEITDPKYRFDILKLKSMYYSLKKDYTKAIIYISKFVHENPNEAKGWIELCMCLKRCEKFDTALNIGEKVLMMRPEANLAFYECLQFICLQKQNKSADDDKLMKLFQHSLHIFPAHLNSWAYFAKFLSAFKEKQFQNVSENVVQFLAIA